MVLVLRDVKGFNELDATVVMSRSTKWTTRGCCGWRIDGIGIVRRIISRSKNWASSTIGTTKNVMNMINKLSSSLLGMHNLSRNMN